MKQRLDNLKRPANRRSFMSKLSWWKTACAAALLCVATPKASPAQTFTTLVNLNYTNGANPYFMSLVQGTVSVAAKKGASLAGRKEPPEWLRDGLDLDHPGPWSLVRLPYGNRAIFHGCRKFPHHLRSASLSQEKSSLFYAACGGPVGGGPEGPHLRRSA